LFSGLKLPRTKATATSGVDAAHILPWSRFDLDGTKNGLCLSKQNHWAFDAGLFRLSFDKTNNVYVLLIPELVRDATEQVDFDIEPFHALVGPIPRKNLPSNEELWPSPKYLDETNRFLDGKSV
jgi:predicted restriction endonuclease